MTFLVACRIIMKNCVDIDYACRASFSKKEIKVKSVIYGSYSFIEEDTGMTVKEIKKLAKERGINGSKMLKADLIRAIQAQEGNTPCFQTGIVSCPQTGCCWWGDCQKG